VTEPEGPQDKTVIAEHSSGSVSDRKELNGKIREAWGSLLNKPGKRAEIASKLGVAETEISPDRPPFEAEVGPSGVIETVILILLAKGFVTGVGAAAGKATFDYLRNLWFETSAPLEDPRTEVIGPPRRPPHTNTFAATGGQNAPPAKNREQKS
jgi:hypothetical protein